MLKDGSALARVSPDDIIYSSELEAEWIKDSQNFSVQVPKTKEDRSLSKNLREFYFSDKLTVIIQLYY